MSTTSPTKSANRLTPQAAEQIDRQQSLTFTFDGHPYQAFVGDTIASALLAVGVRTFSRSFKYHRPRGPMCCAGNCPNCLVQVGVEPSVRSCVRPVSPGMVVTSQNSWPSRDLDIMSLTSLGDRFLPVGFYYKAFIHPRALWPTYERVLRKAAGLGRIDPNTEPGRYRKQYIHADIVIVGAGPAGLSAALATAGSGARVLILDENPSPGGHLRFGPNEARNHLAQLLDEISGTPNITLQTDTTVLGWYEDNWLAAVTMDSPYGGQLLKVRAKQLVIATGAYEQALVFDNNDLPGVMLGSAIQRMLNLYGVVPGRQAVVATTNDDGWQVALDLLRVGRLAGVADMRPKHESAAATQIKAAGLPIFWEHTIAGASGSGRVEKVTLARLASDGSLVMGDMIGITCDLVGISIGWAPAAGLLYQAGGRLEFDSSQLTFLPTVVPSSVYVAGRVNGTFDLSETISEGQQTGRDALVALGLHSPTEDELHSPAEVRRRATRSARHVRIPGNKKRFVCFCEDVTDKDLARAIAEGYDSIELLKRYSTISMGPCQGKMCSQNTIHLCASANEQTIAETGVTTSRPPMIPVELGALAGQTMEPVRLSAIHEWHKAAGSKMLVAGLWLRPEHYGDATAEVRAVRNAVGIIDVSPLGKLRLTGPGVAGLLNRLYTNRWSRLSPGRVRYGLMCNDEGIILDDGVTARLSDDEWYLTTTSSGSSTMFEWIQWWLQSGWGDGVHLTNVTDGNAAFNLAGPKARQLLGRLTDSDITNEAFPYMSVRKMSVAGVPANVLRIGFTGELAYEIHIPAGYAWHVWEAVLEAGHDLGVQPFGLEAQRILRLEKAHIIVGQDTDALSDPISAGESWAVKLDKEDFLGHRSLIAVQENGPTQQLVSFLPDEPTFVPEEGLQIVQSKADGGLEIIGWVTSSRFSPTLGYAIGLCWLPARLAAEKGAGFTIWREGRHHQAMVHHGPFYDPSSDRLRV